MMTPVHWLLLQIRTLHQDGIKVRCKKAVKKILRKFITLVLIFFHRYPKSKIYLLKILKKTGSDAMLRRIVQRFIAVSTNPMMMQLRRNEITTAEMSSRALNIYSELKNKRTGK